MVWKIILLSLLSFPVWADLASQVQRLQWDDLEVVWVKDDRFPTYNLKIYFADGGGSDFTEGATSAMLSLLTYGTPKKIHEQISHELEMKGTMYGAYTMQDFSVFEMGGLLKELKPSLSLVCELFQEASYPEIEVQKFKKKGISRLANLPLSRDALIERIFRYKVTESTPFSSSVEGTLKSIPRLTSNEMKKRLKFFNEQVKKRVYVSGPKEVLSIKDILFSECHWKGQLVRKVSYQANSFSEPKIYFVPLRDSNQTYIRLGSFFSPSQWGNLSEEMATTHFFGGGFTSELMWDLREKKGLTYGAYASFKRGSEYQTTKVGTSTRQEKTIEVLESLKENFRRISQGEVEPLRFKESLQDLAGGFYFSFEGSDDFLQQLMIYDYMGEPYTDLFSFSSRVKQFTQVQMVKSFNRLWNWNNLVVVVMGNPALENELKKWGKIQKINFQDYL